MIAYVHEPAGYRLIPAKWFRMRSVGFSCVPHYYSESASVEEYSAVKPV